MYHDFFGLSTAPFNNTPDPRFFFDTPDHEEALASLVYAARHRKGFALVTGEVGAGKTLLSRLLMERLGEGVRTAVVTHTRLCGGELLPAVCREFEIPLQRDAGHAEIHRALEDYLLEQYGRGGLAVLILDEAQNLSAESFEELRLLSNLEADDAKLLQVLILGQPELQDLFRRPTMRQLYQRVFRSFHLRALSAGQTAGYIAHRLQVAGWRTGDAIFDPDAIEAVFRLSEGVPRVINQICDNAMLAAFSRELRSIGEALVNEVADELMALRIQPAGRPIADAVVRSLPHPNGGDAGGQRPGTARVEWAAYIQQVSQRDEAATAKLYELDRLARRMADRLAASEAALEDVRREKIDAASTAQQAAAALQDVERIRNEAGRGLETVREAARSVESEGERASRQKATLQQHVAELITVEKAELDAARQMRERAAEMLVDVQAAVREAERHGARIQESAQTAADRLKDQADVAAERHAKQAAIVQRQVRQSLQELHAYTRTQRQNLAKLASEERVGIQSAREMRKEAQAILRAALATAEELKKRSADSPGVSGGAAGDAAAARRVEDLIADFHDGRRQMGELLQQARDICESTRAQSIELLQRLREEISAQSSRDQEVWRGAISESQESVTSLESRIAAARRDAEVTRRRLEEFVTGAADTREAISATVEEGRRVVAEVKEEIGKATSDAMATADAASRRLCADSQAVGHSVQHAEKTMRILNRECDAAVERVRGGLLQMLDRAAAAKREIVDIGDHVTADAGQALSRLQGDADKLLTRLESLKHDTTMQERRISALRDGAETAATAIRDHASKVLEQAQVQAAALARQSHELHTQADQRADEQRREAERLVALTAEAREKADDTAERILGEVRGVRDGAVREAEEMREQLVLARLKLVETREDSARLLRELSAMHDASRQRTDALVREAEAVRKKTEEVLAIPQALIDDAAKNAGSLAHMSRKTSSIVEYLSKAGQEADRHRQQISEATAEADEKLDMLKRQTSRVGQLIGIVRQLYGSMDARAKIERIRSRLDQADDLCREVMPRELENLRNILADQVVAYSGADGPSAAGSTSPSPAPGTSGKIVASRKRSDAVAPNKSPPAKGQAALGQIVTRNQKLNQWLRDALREADETPSGAGAVSADRMTTDAVSTKK